MSKSSKRAEILEILRRAAQEAGKPFEVTSTDSCARDVTITVGDKRQKITAAQDFDHRPGNLNIARRLFGPDRANWPQALKTGFGLRLDA